MYIEEPSLYAIHHPVRKSDPFGLATTEDSLGVKCCPEEMALISLRIESNPEPTLQYQLEEPASKCAFLIPLSTAAFSACVAYEAANKIGMGDIATGHTFIVVETRKDGAIGYGFYPTKGHFYPRPGHFTTGEDEASHAYTHSINYTACPESLRKLQETIDEKIKKAPSYSIVPGVAEQCTSWACKTLDRAGFNVPESSTWSEPWTLSRDPSVTDHGKTIFPINN